MDIPAETLTGEAYSLIEAWQGEDDVIIVNAAVTGGPHGSISMWDGNGDELSSRWFRCLPHFLSVAEAVGIARRQGTLPRRLRLYGIEARYFEPGSKASTAVLRGVDKVVDDIASEVTVASFY
jgi:hydrogenase maturation protease